MSATARRRWSLVRRIACLALAGTLLAGCVVEPLYPYRPYPRYYYYR
jgi:hypothetical protein